jgi:hypothetical protein
VDVSRSHVDLLVVGVLKFCLNRYSVLPRCQIELPDVGPLISAGRFSAVS